MTGLAGLAGETILPSWEWAPRRAADLWIFVLVGVSGSFGQFFLNQAFRYGEVSLLAPVEYTGLLWGILYGLVLWNEFPSWVTLVGAAIVAGASLYIAQREARQRRGTGPAAPAS
jgi:drug/metabolite transporter (DMT)-like permease